jgi:hypothetical protein
VTGPEASDDAVKIMSSNWESFCAWLDCQTQWRVLLGMAGLVWLGLDYDACKAVLDDRAASSRVFADLRYMERIALPILNEAG